ncbi:glycerol transporter [Boothiomyces sp. JEL0866]|nr:glycerol transporter [Boothiomyces sp. JEL0866]
MKESYRDALNKPHSNKPHNKKRNRKKKPIKITFVNHIDNEFEKVMQDIQELITSGYEDDLDFHSNSDCVSIQRDLRTDFTPEEIGLHIFDDYQLFNDSSSLSSSVRSNSFWYWALNGSADLDYEKHCAKCPDCSDAPCQKARIIKPTDYTLFNYLVYMFYAPLYLAGPIISFNDFTNQMKQNKATNIKNVLLYTARWIAIVLLMEAMMHTLYVVAIKNAKAFKGFSSLEIYCLGYFNLKFIWLKLMIIWRFFRMWAMFDDIETTENMTRCITNQYSAQEFWKHWHSSYNKFLIRYLYVPLGGKQYKMLNTFCIFTFVAIWHDINLQLLTWGWLISIFILPEIICTKLFCTPKNKEKSWYLDVCALGGVWNLLQMITANLVGFAVGVDGIIEMYHEMWNYEVFTLIVKKKLNTGSSSKKQYY